MKKTPFVLAASIAALLSNHASAQVQATAWLGDGADANWSTTANWNTGVPGGNIRDLSFGAAFQANPAGANSLISNNDLAGYLGHRITFDAGSTAAFIITGNAFTLADDGAGVFPRIENASSALQTFDLGGALTLDGTNALNRAEINATGGDLVFTANTTVALAGDTRLHVGGGAGTTVTFAGEISGAGTGGVQLNQLGTVRFAGGILNTYTGPTAVTAGTLSLEKTAGVTAIAGNLSVSGGTVRLVQGNQIADTSAVTLTAGTLDLGGQDETIGSLAYLGGTLAFNGTQALTLTANGAGPALTIRNVTIANKLAFTGDAGGEIVFDSTNNGTGTLGEIETGGVSRLVTVGNGTAAVDLRVNGIVSGLGFTKAGAGTMELTGGDSNIAGGALAVNNGVLLLNKSGGADAIGSSGLVITSNNTAGFGAATARLAAADQISDLANVTLNANGGVSALLDLNNLTETVGSLTFGSTTVGGAVVRLGATGMLTLNGDITFNNNRNAAGNNAREVLITGTGTRDTAGVGGILNLGNATRTITVSANFTGANLTNADATIEAAIVNGSLVKAGDRILRLGAVNNFSALTVNNGTVRALVDGAIPAGIPLTVSGEAGATATLDFNGFNYTLTAANNLVFGGAGNSVIATGAGTLTLGLPLVYDTTLNPSTSTISGNLNLNGLQDTFDIGDSTGTATELLISAVISGSNTGLRKTGAGNLAISGANTFTGPVTVEAGTLSLRGQNTINVSPVVMPGATIQFDAGLANSTEFNNIMGAAGNGFSIDGGTLRAAMMTDRTFTNRLITLGAGGLTIEATGTYTNFVEGALSQLRFSGQSLSGSGPVTKTGGGRIQFQTANPNFSGPVTVMDGTLEASTGALGNASATNTITLNGGNLAITSGAFNYPVVTMAGGAISANGSSPTISSPSVVVNAPSFFFPNNFWSDNTASALGHSMTVQGVVSGSGDLGVFVNRAGYDNNSGGLILQNPNNTYSGAITVGKNLFLTSNPTGGTGSALGTADVTLMRGKLNLRDNGAGSDGVLNYGTDVIVTEPAGMGFNGDMAGISTITADRASDFNTGNTIQLGSLSVFSTELEVSAANNYRITFAGPTSFAVSPTINVTSGVLTLAGGLNAAGQTFTKTGAGTLRVLGTADLLGYTLSGGVLEIATEPAGAGRDLALPFGTGFSAGYVATQANLIDRVTLDSEGMIGLGVSSTFNPDFSLFQNGPTGQRVRLGATADVTLTGVITPWSDNIYRLGGGGGTLTLASANVISGAGNLDVNTSGTTPGTVVLAAANNFSGSITIGGGMILGAGSNASLGSTSVVTLDNGTLHLREGGDFSGFNRAINLGAGGGALNIGNGITITSPLLTSVTGTGAFTKLGGGTLILGAANPSFAGPFAVGGGTVLLQNVAALGTSTAGITVGAGGTLALEANVDLGARPIGISGSGAGGTGAIRNVSGDNRIGAAVTLQAAASIMAEIGSLTLDVATGNAIAGAFPLTVGGAGDVIVADPTANLTSLTKNGTGTLRFTGDPNHTGLTTINGGVIDLANSGGTTDFNTVINSGGILRVSIANKMGDATDVTVNAGGLLNIRADDTMDMLAGDGTVNAEGATAARTLTVNNSGGASMFAGVIEDGGAFALNFTKGTSNNALILTGVSTYTGNTNVNGPLRIEGNGSISGSNQFFLNRNNSVLILGSPTDTNPTVDRIRDTAQIELQDSSNLVFNGVTNPATTTTETFGQLETNGGNNVVTLNPGVGSQLEITAGSILRSAAGTLVVRGTGLGGTGADTSRLIFTTEPTGANFIGGGGAPDTTTQSIIPYVIGDTSLTGAGRTFVTHSPIFGVRPLQNHEYAPTFVDGVQTADNVSLASALSFSNRSTINALRLENGGSVSMSALAGLTVSSGAILDVSAAGRSITGGSISFGGQPIVFHLPGADAATPITMSVTADLVGGLTTAGTFAFSAANAASVLELGGFNVFGGEINISKGILELNGPGALNPFARNQMRFTSEGNTGLAILRLNGHSILEGTLASHNGRVENGAATAATIGFTQTGDVDANLFLADGGTGSLNLLKEGANRLSFTADSTFTGTATVRAGTLEVKNQGDWDTVSAIIVEGGTFKLFNTDGGNAQNQNSNNDRLSSTAQIRLRGGTFLMDHNNNSGINYSERVGALRIESGVNTVTATQHGTTTRMNSVTFNAGDVFADSLVRNQGAVVNFAGTGLGATTRSRIQIGPDGTVANPETALLRNGILGGWATVGNDFATISGDLNATTADSQHSITALTAYETGAPALWTNTSNVKTTGSVTLTGGHTINSLVLGNGHDLNLGGSALVIDSGGLLAVHTDAAADKVIAGGSITAGVSNELIIKVDNSTVASTVADLTLTANVTDNGSAVSLTKWGAGDMKLSGIGTDFSGHLNVTQGSVVADSTLFLGANAPGRLLRMANGVLLNLGGSLADEALPFSGIELTTIGQGIVRGAKNQTLTFNGAITGDGSLRFENAVSGTISALDVSGSLVIGGRDDTTILSAPLPASNVTIASGDQVVGGTLTVGNDQRIATVTQLGGTLSVGFEQVAADLNIGHRGFAVAAGTAATKGTLDLSATTNFTAQVANLRIGSNTTTGSASTAEGDLIIGQNSHLRVGTEILVGDSQESGNTNVESSITFGSGVNVVETSRFVLGGRKSTARAMIAPGGTLVMSGFATGTADLFIGRNNVGTGTTTTGTFDMSGGTFIADLDELVVGQKTGDGTNNGGVSGFLQLSANAANSITANSLIVGDRQGNDLGGVNGTVDLAGGTFNVLGNASFGLANGTRATGNGTTGTLNVSGGSFSVGGDMILGARQAEGIGNALLNISGGSVTVGGKITTMDSTEVNASVSLTGGTLDVTGGTISADVYTLESGTLRNVSQLYAGDSVTAVDLTKAGPGTLAVEGANNYTGNTRVTGGTLRLAGSLSGTVAVEVGDQAVLSGTGTINPAALLSVLPGGTLSPGDTVGVLNTGSIDLWENSQFVVQIGGQTAGTQYDQLNVTGSIMLNSNLQGSLLSGLVLHELDVFTIMLNDGTDAVSGTFANGQMVAEYSNVYQTVFLNGLPFLISYNAENGVFDAGALGNDVALMAVVPEPASALVLLAGLGAIAGTRRTRGRRA